MTISFAPNNNHASRILYTGRSDDIDGILKLILAGNCVAIYGERRSGKTLTLEMLKLIINGDINKIQSQLVDQRFKNRLSVWTNMLGNHKSLYISLTGLRTNEEFHNRVLSETYECGLLTKKDMNSKGSRRTQEILDKLQQIAQQNAKSIVILIDEMETLSVFENGNALAELFCDRVRYSRLIFVHTGSHQWLERVYSPGSLFTHLIPLYLGSVEKNDLENFLLKPLNASQSIEFVVNMSGCKPLYAQHIAQRIQEDNLPLSVSVFLEDTALTTYIQRCIYDENNLDVLSKNILSAIAHHPKADANWIAIHLKENKIKIKERLKVFEKFGTIMKDLDDRYQIVGDIIEEYGKQLDDPVDSNFGKPAREWFHSLIVPARWILMVCFLISAIGLYFYANPKNSIEKYDSGKWVLQVEYPYSLEVNEMGKINIWVTNRDTVKMDDLSFVFDSENIRYSKDGKNFVSFKDIEPGATFEDSLDYYVYSTGNVSLNNKVLFKNQPILLYDIQPRPIPIKKYSLLLSSFIGLVAVFIPGKQWLDAFKLFANLLSDKSKAEQ